MQVCSVCNEIVSAGMGCDRSNCPIQSAAPIAKAQNTGSGATGRADNAVQAGLDRAGDVARTGTRKALMAIIFALIIGGAALMAYRSLKNTGSPWDFEKIDLAVGPEGITTATDPAKVAAIGIWGISYSSLGPGKEGELVSALLPTEGEPGLGELIVSRRADCSQAEFATLSLPGNRKLESRRIDYSDQVTGFRFKLKPFETAVVHMRNSGSVACSYFQIDRTLSKSEWGQDDEAALGEMANVRPITKETIGQSAYSAEGLELRLASADPVKGEDSFAKCKACHTINEGGANGIGPNLYAVLGDNIGVGRGGFAFSDGLKKTGGKWDWVKLDAWLASPKAFASGTKMTFAGLSDPQERANIMAYLNSQGSNLPLPSVPSTER